MSLGSRLGPQFLSKQLFLPLITLTEFALKASQPLSQVDDASWTKVCSLSPSLPCSHATSMALSPHLHHLIL